MQAALKQTVTVQAGGLIQVCSPELKEGMQAEVIILLEVPAVDECADWSEEDLQALTLESDKLIMRRLEEEENA